MTKAIAIIFLLLTFTDSSEAFEEWSRTEKILFSAELALATIDYYQTIKFPRYRLEEANPVMRPFTGSRRKLAMFVVGIHLLEFGLLSGFPEMRPILWPQVFLHLGVVINNQRLMIKMEATF